MSDAIYAVRGRAGTARYKISGGRVVGATEARGEDFWPSRHLAIFHSIQAIRKWRYTPIGVVFDVHIKEGETP